MVLKDGNCFSSYNDFAPELINYRGHHVNKGFSLYWSWGCSREATVSLNILWHHLSSLLFLLIPLSHWLLCLHLNVWNKSLSHVLCSNHSLYQAHMSPDIVLALSLFPEVYVQLSPCFLALPECSAQIISPNTLSSTPGFVFFIASVIFWHSA